MATRRRNDYGGVAGAPTGTSSGGYNWVDSPTANPESTMPTIQDPAVDVSQLGSTPNSTNRSTNIGPWAGGYGAQPESVNVPAVTPAPSGGGAGFGGIAGDWTRPTRDMIRAYGRTRGFEMNDQQADYWVNQWANLMRETPNDPSYATMRLSLADEWTPANQRYMAGQGSNEFNDRWGGSLENLVQQFLGNSRERGAALANTYRTRAKELRENPAYTSQDEAAIRARAFDQLERRRQETLRNSRENIYARGFAPTSGIVAGRDRELNEQFEGVRTGIESDLLRAQLDETNRRRDAALQLEALATEALNGGDLGAIQAVGLPLQLMNTRQNNALATYNASQGNTLSQLMQLINLASGNRDTNRANAQNNAAGLGGLIQLILGGI